MKIFIAVAVLVSLTSACATTGRGRLKNVFSDEISQSRQSVRTGSTAGTIEELSMVLEMDPKNEEALFLRGVAYQKSENIEGAIEDYENLLKRDPNHAKAHYNLGMIHAFKTNNKEEALKHFDSFITLDPEHPACRTVADTMLSLDAEPEKDTPSHLNPLIEAVLAQRGVVRASGEDDAKKQKDALARAIRQSPSSAVLYFAMARALENESRFGEAVKYYEKALSLHPTFAECHRFMGQLLLRMKKNADAQIHLTKASLFDPNRQALNGTN